MRRQLSIFGAAQKEARLSIWRAGVAVFVMLISGVCMAESEQFAIPSRLVATGMPVLDGKIWLVCGTVGMSKGGLYQFDPASRSWLHASGIDESRWGGDLIAAGDALYLLGGGRTLGAAPAAVGRDSMGNRGGRPIPGVGGASRMECIAEVSRYLPGRNRWERLRPMPRARINFAACAVGSTIYVFGGRSFVAYSEATRRLPESIPDIDAFDMRTGRWHAAGVAPVDWKYLTAIPDGDGIILLGNIGNGSGASGKFMRYDPVNSTWSPISELPISVGFGSILAAADGKGLVTIWNKDQGFVFNRASASWDPVEPPPEFPGWGGLPYPTQRKQVSLAAAIDGTIFAFGEPYGGGFDSLDIYDPVSRKWTGVPIRARWPVAGGTSSYLEGERYAGNDIGEWSLHRADGATLFEDVRAVLRAQLGSATGMERISALESDIDGDGRKEFIFQVTPGYDSKTLLVYGADLKWRCTEQFGALTVEVLGRMRAADPPMLGGYILLGASAGESEWIFYRWVGGRLQKVLDALIESVGVQPQYVDLNNDGYNEVLFEIRSKYMERVPAQIFTWDREKQEFIPGSDKFPAYWQAIIDRELPLFSGMRAGDGIYVQAYRLAHAYKLRGKEEGKDGFLRLVKEKLDPILKNTRNDYHQQRAGQVLKEVKAILQQ